MNLFCIDVNFQLIKYLSQRLSQSAKRQRFLNFSRMVALVSVVLGSIALLVSLAVLSGFDNALHEKAIRFTSHIKLFAYNREPLPDYQKTIENIKFKFPEIEAVAPVIEREGLIRSKTYIEGIVIRGIKTDLDITHQRNNIIQGKFDFSNDNAKEIIIGKRLAKKLNVSVGDSIIVYAMREERLGAMTYPDISRFKINGIYETGMAKYDDMVIYIPFGKAASIFRIPEGSTLAYDIMLKDVSMVKPVLKALEEELGYPYYGLTVFDIHGSMFAWIELQKEPIPIVLGLISIVAVFNILTILLVTVVEKTKTIGILRTLGLRNRDIMSLFVFQGTKIGLYGTLIGSAIALLFCILQSQFHLIHLPGEIYFVDSLPVDINPLHYLIVIGTAVSLSFLATLIPSFIAVRVNTITALRFR
jgi:lipoprotein-releasing system permease protein